MKKAKDKHLVIGAAFANHLKSESVIAVANAVTSTLPYGENGSATH